MVGEPGAEVGHGLHGPGRLDGGGETDGGGASHGGGVEAMGAEEISAACAPALRPSRTAPALRPSRTARLPSPTRLHNWGRPEAAKASPRFGAGVSEKHTAPLASRPSSRPPHVGAPPCAQADPSGASDAAKIGE